MKTQATVHDLADGDFCEPMRGVHVVLCVFLVIAKLAFLSWFEVLLLLIKHSLFDPARAYRERRFLQRLQSCTP